MRIAIIGAGNVGQALGGNWSAKGHDVIFGVRQLGDPGLARLLAGAGATEALPAAAAAQADVVVLALPWAVAEGAVKALGELEGKVVIDCMNPLTMTDGALGLDRGFTNSGAETVQSWLPRAHVVKTLNQVGAEIMANPSILAAIPVMFLAGDDVTAKAKAAALVTDAGFEALDAGPLRQARLLEPFAMLWINQAIVRGEGRKWALGVLRGDES
ncbi:MAG: NAD(P)-binding domain-containing protein [Parvularculaceae bacterium]|nr:NAD(P)-binding domain-containing protein [Parvularculaceae bacterium]